MAHPKPSFGDSTNLRTRFRPFIRVSDMAPFSWAKYSVTEPMVLCQSNTKRRVQSSMDIPTCVAGSLKPSSARLLQLTFRHQPCLAGIECSSYSRNCTPPLPLYHSGNHTGKWTGSSSLVLLVTPASSPTSTFSEPF